MKIAVIGGTGFIGSKIVAEALSKGHKVVSISLKNEPKKEKNLIIKRFSIFQKDQLVEAIKDVDLVISAYHPGYFHVNIYQRFIEGYEVIVEVVKKLNKRLIMVLGSSSLKLSDGSDFDDDVSFSGAWKDTLEGTKAVYNKYVNDLSFNWTMVSPAAEVVDIDKRGDYTIGFDNLIVNKANVSRIGVSDLAEAIINEAEEEKFKNKRFTIGYLN